MDTAPTIFIVSFHAYIYFIFIEDVIRDFSSNFNYATSEYGALSSSHNNAAKAVCVAALTSNYWRREGSCNLPLVAL